MKKSFFQKLLGKHKDRVFSYAFYVLRNREDAEDVTQEVFIKLWQNLDRIDKNRCGAWIMRVSHNQCISLTRKRRASLSREEVLDKVGMENVPAKVNTNFDPELSCELNEKQKSLFLAMKKLPVKTRSMLILHYYNGLKYQTIGEIFNISVNTVKVQVHRGRKQLRDILAGEFPEKAGKR